MSLTGVITTGVITTEKVDGVSVPESIDSTDTRHVPARVGPGCVDSEHAASAIATQLIIAVTVRVTTFPVIGVGRRRLTRGA